ncbi:hypothetical protein CDD83_7913 [Cordyceps sp. RAO-2017]|nr:hypothetical protein CDD83_7913 [Cordyceps sp. RAO-2017]
MAAFGPLRSTAQLMNAAVDSGQVPNEIRRSLELVRTCHQDLKHLITLRNENLTILETKPRDLERLNRVISEATDGLAEASRIVEKCRPEAHAGSKTPLRKRLAWVLGDSLHFQSQQPVVSRHHATVLAELNFLRQLALWAAPAQGRENDYRSLLGESLLGERVGNDFSISSKASTSTLRPSSAITHLDSLKQHIEYSDLPEPVHPDTLAKPSAATGRQADAASFSRRSAGHKYYDPSDLTLGPGFDDPLGLSVLLNAQAPASSELAPLRHEPSNISDTHSGTFSSAGYQRSTVSISSSSIELDAGLAESFDPLHGQSRSRRATTPDLSKPRSNDRDAQKYRIHQDAGAVPSHSKPDLDSCTQSTTALHKYKDSHPHPPHYTHSTEHKYVAMPPCLIPGAKSPPSTQAAQKTHRRIDSWQRFAPFGAEYVFPAQSSEARAEDFRVGATNGTEDTP